MPHPSARIRAAWRFWIEGFSALLYRLVFRPALKHAPAVQARTCIQGLLEDTDKAEPSFSGSA